MLHIDTIVRKEKSRYEQKTARLCVLVRVQGVEGCILSHVNIQIWDIEPKR